MAAVKLCCACGAYRPDVGGRSIAGGNRWLCAYHAAVRRPVVTSPFVFYIRIGRWWWHEHWVMTERMQLATALADEQAARQTAKALRRTVFEHDHEITVVRADGVEVLRLKHPGGGKAV